MPQGPKKVSKTPTRLDLENPRDDVLADVLSATLLGNALYKLLEAGAPWGIRVPARERTVFYLIVRGSALIEVDGEAARPLSAGDVAFIPHGTAHTLRDSASTRPEPVCDGPSCQGHASSAAQRLGGGGAPSTIFTGFFARAGVRGPALLEGMPRLLLLPPTDRASGPWLSATVQLVLAESAAPGPASAVVLQRLADILFIQALRSLSSHRECGSHRGLAALSDPPVHKALGLMHARVADPWTVAKLAGQVGLSRSGFASRFAGLVGEPPLQYLARWRMARAAELLRDTDEGIAGVAARVGYESVPSFSKAFKRWQGSSPGAFRKGQGRARRPPRP